MPDGEILSDAAYKALEPATGGAGFKNDPDSPTSLRNVELNIRKDKVAENGVIFDKQGNPILALSQGDPTGVDFSGGQINKIRALNGEAVFTHNHPRSTSFSGKDLAFILYGNFKEFRIISDRFAYSISDPKGTFRKMGFTYPKGKTGEGKFNPGFTTKDLSEMRNKAWDSLSDEKRAAHTRDAIDNARKYGTAVEDELDIISSHLGIQEIAKKFGLEYRRTPLKN